MAFAPKGQPKLALLPLCIGAAALPRSLGAFCLLLVTQLPFWYLLWPFWKLEIVPVAWPKPSFAYTAFAAFLIAFGSSTYWIPERYYLSAAGWTMFSNTLSNRVSYHMDTPAMRCYNFEGGGFTVRKIEKPDKIRYGSHRQQDLEILRELFVTKRHCPGAPIEIAAIPANGGRRLPASR